MKRLMNQLGIILCMSVIGSIWIGLQAPHTSNHSNIKPLTRGSARQPRHYELSRKIRSMPHIKRDQVWYLSRLKSQNSRHPEKNDGKPKGSKTSQNYTSKDIPVPPHLRRDPLRYGKLIPRAPIPPTKIQALPTPPRSEVRAIPLNRSSSEHGISAPKAGRVQPHPEKPISKSDTPGSSRTVKLNSSLEGNVTEHSTERNMTKETGALKGTQDSGLLGKPRVISSEITDKSDVAKSASRGVPYEVPKRDVSNHTMQEPNVKLEPGMNVHGSEIRRSPPPGQLAQETRAQNSTHNQYIGSTHGVMPSTIQGNLVGPHRHEISLDPPSTTISLPITLSKPTVPGAGISLSEYTTQPQETTLLRPTDQTSPSTLSPYRLSPDRLESTSANLANTHGDDEQTATIEPTHDVHSSASPENNFGNMKTMLVQGHLPHESIAEPINRADMHNVQGVDHQSSKNPPELLRQNIFSQMREENRDPVQLDANKTTSLGNMAQITTPAASSQISKGNELGPNVSASYLGIPTKLPERNENLMDISKPASNQPGVLMMLAQKVQDNIDVLPHEVKSRQDNHMPESDQYLSSKQDSVLFSKESDLKQMSVPSQVPGSASTPHQQLGETLSYNETSHTQSQVPEVSSEIVESNPGHNSGDRDLHSPPQNSLLEGPAFSNGATIMNKDQESTNLVSNNLSIPHPSQGYTDAYRDGNIGTANTGASHQESDLDLNSSGTIESSSNLPLQRARLVEASMLEAKPTTDVVREHTIAVATTQSIKEHLKPLCKQSQMVQQLPNVLYIGERKTGTTATIKFLKDLNPQIKTNGYGEPHYFDNPERFLKGLKLYRSLLGPSCPGDVIIDKTPSYFRGLRAINRIYDYNPNIKLLVSMRDPISRAISDYKFEILRLDQGKTRADNKELRMVYAQTTFDELAVKSNGEINEEFAPVQRSLYDVPLARWLAKFDIKQFHFIDADNFVTNPVEELQQIERFLGFEPKTTPERLVFNATKGKFCVKGSPCVGSSDLVTPTTRPAPKPSLELIQKLTEYYRPHVKKLYEIMHKKLSWMDKYITIQP